MPVTLAGQPTATSGNQTRGERFASGSRRFGTGVNTALNDPSTLAAISQFANAFVPQNTFASSLLQTSTGLNQQRAAQIAAENAEAERVARQQALIQAFAGTQVPAGQPIFDSQAATNLFVNDLAGSAQATPGTAIAPQSPIDNVRSGPVAVAANRNFPQAQPVAPQRREGTGSQPNPFSASQAPDSLANSLALAQAVEPSGSRRLAFGIPLEQQLAIDQQQTQQFQNFVNTIERERNLQLQQGEAESLQAARTGSLDVARGNLAQRKVEAEQRQELGKATIKARQPTREQIIERVDKNARAAAAESRAEAAEERAVERQPFTIQELRSKAAERTAAIPFDDITAEAKRSLSISNVKDLDDSERQLITDRTIGAVIRRRELEEGRTVNITPRERFYFSRILNEPESVTRSFLGIDSIRPDFPQTAEEQLQATREQALEAFPDTGPDIQQLAPQNIGTFSIEGTTITDDIGREVILTPDQVNIVNTDLSELPPENHEEYLRRAFEVLGAQ